MSELNLLGEGIVPCFVDGKAFIGSTSYEVLDPHSKKLLHTASAVTSEDVDKVIAVAEKAFASWKLVSRRCVIIFLLSCTHYRQLKQLLLFFYLFSPLFWHRLLFNYLLTIALLLK